MIQYFEWYLKSDPPLYQTLMKEASSLSKMGFTHVWLPPAYKGQAGINDVGYGVYDMYDLGEFDQKEAYGQNMEQKTNISRQLMSVIKILYRS